MLIDTSTVRRLAFVKFLYSLGLNQSKAAEPYCSASLLTFHNSVELYLQVACEFVDAGGQQPNFMQYWELIAAKLPDEIELTQKESMRRLNKARVELKHRGTLPSKLDLELFRATTTAFLYENTPIIFSEKFDEISLVEFVDPDEAKDQLKLAYKNIENQDLDKAIDSIALAFELMLFEYEERKKTRYGRSPFFFGEDFTFHNSFFMRVDNSNLGEFIDKTKESIEKMQQAIKILALGLDYRRYSRFKMHMPSISRSLAGTYTITRGNRSFSPEMTKEDVIFCIEFVIEAAITLQEFDYEIESDTFQNF